MTTNILALLIAAGAMLVITRDLSRLSGLPSSKHRLLRALPFVFFAGLSLFTAVRAPRGRHPFRTDLSLSWDDLANSLSKVQHLRGFAVLALLAVVAFGTQRLLVAFLATMALGIVTELGQTTVVGHNARLADLAPDALGCIVSILLVAGLRRAAARRRELRSDPLRRTRFAR
jgi:VanZ family protein